MAHSIDEFVDPYQLNLKVNGRAEHSLKKLFSAQKTKVKNMHWKVGRSIQWKATLTASTVIVGTRHMAQLAIASNDCKKENGTKMLCSGV